MKRNIIKTSVFICSFICLMAVFIFNASAKNVTSGDFVFSVSGTSATVKEYKGTAASVKIPAKVGNATVKKIGNEAFWSVKTMTSVTIPSTVTSIGEAAFNECTGLKKIVIPSKVTKIGSAAFWYCTSLKSIVIPESVTSIGANAFRGCNSLTAYVVKGSFGEKHIKSLDGIKLGYRYATSVKLDKTAVTLQVGSAQKLTATLAPTPLYNKKVKYSTSAKAVATVASDGTVTAVAPGTATITCTAKDGSGKKATCKITVTPQKVTGLKQSGTTPTSYTLKWNKSAGATKYTVFCYNEKTKKWDKLAYTTTNSYKVANLAMGSSRKYKVRAFTQIGKTYYKAPDSSAFTAKPTYPRVPQGLEATVGVTAITLKWSKAANATGYRVFFYNPETKVTTFIKKTTGTSLKVSSLDPNTDYSFVVRSYLTHNKKTIYSDFSKSISCTTRPGYVQNLRVKENSVFVSKLTLQWDALSYADGYRILILDSESNTYLPFRTIDGGNNTEYTVEELESGTSYTFKIQAFVKNGDTAVYGNNSKTPVTVTTNSRPGNSQEAFTGFIEAYNASKNNTKNFSLIANTSVSNFVGENSEEYTSVLSSVAADSTAILHFSAGIESVSKSPVTSILAPKNAFSTLSFEQITTDSVSFTEDGNGYRISFNLGEDDGTVNALITDTIDWDKVAEDNSGFVLNECKYGGTTVNAKVQNGFIDDITVTVPVTVKFTIGEKTYEFSETITKEYLFIW